MDRIAAEVVISAVVVFLLVMVIALFRGNLEVVSASAEMTSDLDKIKIKSLLPVENNIVNGSDVISAIRYYCEKEDVEIAVNVNGNEKLYIEEGYSNNPSDTGYFYIPYSSKFEATYEYENDDISYNFV